MQATFGGLSRAMDETIDVRDAIAPQIFANLRKAIVRLQLRPGQALSEKEIAGRFGTSRQPVREAFIKLAEAGLVRILPQRGTFVTKIAPTAVADARFVREAMEVAVAQACCAPTMEIDLAPAWNAVAMQAEAGAREDHEAFLAQDERFHQLLAEAIQCAEAFRVVETTKAQMDRVRYLSLPDASPINVLIDQHRDILNAIEARDAEAAAAAVRVHLREILLALPQLAARYPDLFEEEELPHHAADIQARYVDAMAKV